MGDNNAVLHGFTKKLCAIAADNGEARYLLVKPDTYGYSARFRAWDLDSQEFVTIHGWLYSFISAI